MNQQHSDMANFPTLKKERFIITKKQALLKSIPGAVISLVMCGIVVGLVFAPPANDLANGIANGVTAFITAMISSTTTWLQASKYFKKDAN